MERQTAKVEVFEHLFNNHIHNLKSIRAEPNPLNPEDDESALEQLSQDDKAEARAKLAQVIDIRNRLEKLEAITLDDIVTLEYCSHQLPNDVLANLIAMSIDYRFAPPQGREELIAICNQIFELNDRRFLDYWQHEDFTFGEELARWKMYANAAITRYIRNSLELAGWSPIQQGSEK